MDLFKTITDRMIHMMEQGQIPWQQPWQASGAAVSHVTGKPYSLLNQMLLGKAGEYATYKQVQQEGGWVRKGEKASMVVFWKWIDKEDEETGEVKQVPFLRYYNVFHLEQCEGLEAKHSKPLPNSAHADEAAEAIIADYVKREGVTLEHHQGDRAFYRPSTDTITLPLMEQFAETAEYYSTLLHECVHSTGHMNRLNRLDATAFFGSDAYSKEELIAEIGSAALVNHAGLETAKSFRNSAAYVQNWLQVLKNDKRFIVSVAGKAEKAVDLMLGE